MSVSATAAAQAYAAIAKNAGIAAKATPASVDAQATGFGDLLKEAMTSVTEAGKATDQTALSQVAGKADMIDVVTAVTETELAVQTLVTVRDRVITAYQEVMRMPI